jgi:enamine deaminase RidA (YjgF/YER057c/UK114 family)
MSINKKSFRSGPFADFIAQGVQVDNILYMAGQVGIDSEGNTPEHIGDQAKLAFESLKEVLAEFGADMSNVVDETFFVTDMDALMANVNEIYNAREEAYGGKPEVSQTVLQVVALVQPELKIEIKCIAHL